MVPPRIRLTQNTQFPQHVGEIAMLAILAILAVLSGLRRRDRALGAVGRQGRQGLTVPAVQHPLLRPLTDRAAFKALATRQIVVGAFSLALALVSATQVVLSAVLGHMVGNVAAAAIGLLTVGVWWILPRRWRSRGIV